MNMPLVSIIIPVYNGADYLREAVDSALAQTYPHCEVIVVNDGSADNGATEAICRSYGERIRYFAKENGGVASALNMGIEVMRGEYFSWLSHDDVYLPDKIAGQVRFVQRFELDEAVLYTDYQTIDEHGRLLVEVGLPSWPPHVVPRELYSSSRVHGCTLFIPRKVFDKVGRFREDLPTVQDYDLWMTMSRAVPFVHAAGATIKARQHAAQGSRNNPVHVAALRDFSFKWLPEAFAEAGRQGPSDASDFLARAIVNRCQGKLFRSAFDLFFFGMQRLSVARALGLVLFCCKEAAKKICKKLPEPARKYLQRLAQAGKEQATGKKNDAAYRLDFSGIYENRGFLNEESRSGEGSTLFQTRIVRRELAVFFKQYGVRSLLDIPCGDFNWMRHVDLGDITYTGGDIVPAMIERNSRLFATERRRFQVLDLINAPLPKADVVFCRDCLTYLPFVDIHKALSNIKASGSTWLLTTSFVEREHNADLDANTVWRTLNLQKAPFLLPFPVAAIDEKCTECGGVYADKRLLLWRIADLPTP